MRTVAVVLAGGSGLRLGGGCPKQLQPLAGRPMLEYSVAAFDAAPEIDDILVVMAPDLIGQARAILGTRFGKLRDVIAGGTDRPGSTRRAIELLSSAGWASTSRDGADHRVPLRAGADRAAGPSPATAPDCNVLFHDAARPLGDRRVIGDCVRALGDCEARGVAIPTADTIVEVSDGLMTAIPARETLARCQTPQGFRLSVIRRAYELAEADLLAGRFTATDDCGVVLRYLPRVPIRIVPGSDRNIKITYPADLAVAETMLAGAEAPAAG